MSKPLQRRTELAAGFPRRNRIARALAFVVALLVLFVSLSAEAKKKKGGKKKGKPPASKSKGKEALPASEPETDSASSDEKSSGDDDDDDDKPKTKAPPAASEPVPDEEAEAKPVRKKSKPAADAKEDESAAGGLVALRIGVGGGALFRQVAWTDNRQGVLAPYTLSPGPEAGVWFEAFPAAFGTDGFAANIGVFGRFNYGFGASSRTPAGQTLTTKYQDFLGGVKIRIPLGTVVPYISGAYGMQKFALEPPDVSRPNFNYVFVHGGGGALFQITPEFDIDLNAAYVHVLNPGSSAGEIAAPAPYYPRTTAYGFDGRLSVGYRVMSMIGIRAGVDFRQFGVNTHWRSTDTSAPTGGAVDRYITAWGGLEVVFDGVGGGAGGGESAPPPAAPAKKPPADGEPSVEPSEDKDKETEK